MTSGFQPHSQQNLNGFRKAFSLQAPVRNAPEVQKLLHSVDHRLDWTYSGIINNRIQDLTNPEQMFPNALLIDYIKFIYDNYGVMDPLVKYGKHPFTGHSAVQEKGREARRQPQGINHSDSMTHLYTLGNKSKTPGLNPQPINHKDSISSSFSRPASGHRRIMSYAGPVNQPDERMPYQQPVNVVRHPSFNMKIDNQTIHNNYFPLQKPTANLQRQSFNFSKHANQEPPQSIKATDIHVAPLNFGLNLQTQKETDQLNHSVHSQRRPIASQSKSSLTDRPNVPKRPKMLGSSSKVHRESETPISSFMDPDFAVDPRYPQPPRIERVSSFQYKTADPANPFQSQQPYQVPQNTYSLTNKASSVPLATNLTSWSPNPAETDLDSRRRPFVQTQIKSSYAGSQGQKDETNSRNQYNQQRSVYNYQPIVVNKPDYKTDTVNKSKTFNPAVISEISNAPIQVNPPNREQSTPARQFSRTQLGQFMQNGHLGQRTFGSQGFQPTQQQASNPRNQSNRLQYETPLKESKKYLKIGDDQTTLHKDGVSRRTDYPLSSERDSFTTSHHRVNSNFDMTSTNSTQIPSIYRYCFICEHPILEFNINAHEQNCPAFKTLYGKTFQQIIEMLVQKIHRQEKQIQYILENEQENRLKNLRNVVSTWLHSVKEVPTNGDNSLQMERNYQQIMRCFRSKELKLLELSHKLKWFLSIRQHIKQSFSV